MDNRDTDQGREQDRYGADRDRETLDQGRDQRAFSGRRDDRFEGGAGEQSYGRPGQYRSDQAMRGDSGGDRYGQRDFGDASGDGGYGPRGYAADPGRDRSASPALGGRGGGTYGQEDFSRAAQRSQWRDDQRYGDRGVSGETWRNEDERSDLSRSENYGAVDSARQYGAAWTGNEPRHRHGRHEAHQHDHEPHYRRWREEQLAGHDRDYAHWREGQARRYDEDYGAWRDQRRQSFHQEFEGFRQTRGGVHEHPSLISGTESSPTGAAGGDTGLSGAETGARGAQTGHSSMASGVASSTGGATGSAGITGGGGAGLTNTEPMGGVIEAFQNASPAPHSRPGSGTKATAPSGMGQTTTEPVQDVADGGSGRAHKDHVHKGEADKQDRGD